MREKESGWKNSMWKKLRRRSTSIHEVFINPLTTCEILNVCRDSFLQERRFAAEFAKLAKIVGLGVQLCSR